MILETGGFGWVCWTGSVDVVERAQHLRAGHAPDGRAVRQERHRCVACRPTSSPPHRARTGADRPPRRTTRSTTTTKVIGKLAGLDQRLAAQVNQSAQIVTTGRQNLDAVRQWVLDAAASVPPGKNREQMLMPIVQRGLGQVTDIVTKSNGELPPSAARSAPRQRVPDPRQPEVRLQGGVGPQPTSRETKAQRTQARRHGGLTRKAVVGDQAAAKVDEILNGITPTTRVRTASSTP